jgi:hypothetical protein
MSELFIGHVSLMKKRKVVAWKFTGFQPGSAQDER